MPDTCKAGRRHLSVSTAAVDKSPLRSKPLNERSRDFATVNDRSQSPLFTSATAQGKVDHLGDELTSI